MNEIMPSSNDNFYKKEAYREWLKNEGGLTGRSPESYISYMNNLNKDVIGKDENGESFFNVLSSLIESNQYAEIMILFEHVDQVISSMINPLNPDNKERKKLNDCRSGLRKYRAFIVEELDDIPDEEEIEELNGTLPLKFEQKESEGSGESENVVTYDHEALEDNFTFRLLTQNRMSEKKDVFYPIGIIRKLFKYSQKNGLSSGKDYEWLMEWVNNCVNEILVITADGMIPLRDVKELIIHPNSKSIEISKKTDGSKKYMVYTETNNKSDEILPMEVNRLRDIHIDHTPSMSNILSDELPNLKALPRLTEIIKQVAKKRRIKVTTKNFGKISKKLFADDAFIRNELVPLIEYIKEDLELLRKKSSLKLMAGKYNLKKK